MYEWKEEKERGEDGGKVREAKGRITMYKNVENKKGGEGGKAYREGGGGSLPTICLSWRTNSFVKVDLTSIREADEGQSECSCRVISMNFNKI